MKWCFFRMMVNFVSLTLDFKTMEVMMIRRKAVAVHQLGSKESLGLSILLDFWKSRQ